MTKSQALSDQSLDTIRARAQATQSPDWVEQYGDASWDAAMAVMGLAPMTPPD